MAVQVVEPDHPLAPGMFHHPAQGLQVGIGPQLLEESIQVLRFKGQLHVVGLGVNLRPGESRQPVEVLLKGEPAGKGYVDPIVLADLQSEQILIKSSGGLDIRHREHHCRIFHLSRSFSVFSVKKKLSCRSP